MQLQPAVLKLWQIQSLLKQISTMVLVQFKEHSLALKPTKALVLIRVPLQLPPIILLLQLRRRVLTM